MSHITYIFHCIIHCNIIVLGKYIPMFVHKSKYEPCTGQSMYWVFIISTCSFFNQYATSTSHNQQVNCMLKCFATNWLQENRVSVWSNSRHMKPYLANSKLNWKSSSPEKSFHWSTLKENSQASTLLLFTGRYQRKNQHLHHLFKIKTLFFLDQVGLLIFIFTSSVLLEFQLFYLLKLRYLCCLCNIEKIIIKIKTQLVYWLGIATVLTKQLVSAYSEAIIRFTNVSYRRLVTMRGLWPTHCY